MTPSRDISLPLAQLNASYLPRTRHSIPIAAHPAYNSSNHATFGLLGTSSESNRYAFRSLQGCTLTYSVDIGPARLDVFWKGTFVPSISRRLVGLW